MDILGYSRVPEVCEGVVGLGSPAYKAVVDAGANGHVVPFSYGSVCGRGGNNCCSDFVSGCKDKGGLSASWGLEGWDLFEFEEGE